MATQIIEGTLTISMARERYVGTFAPHERDQRAPGQPVIFWSRQAVADFLQEISIRPARMIAVMDDLRDEARAVLPTVSLTRAQAAIQV